MSVLSSSFRAADRFAASETVYHCVLSVANGCSLQNPAWKISHFQKNGKEKAPEIRKFQVPGEEKRSYSVSRSGLSKLKKDSSRSFTGTAGRLLFCCQDFLHRTPCHPPDGLRPDTRQRRIRNQSQYDCCCGKYGQVLLRRSCGSAYDR